LEDHEQLRGDGYYIYIERCYVGFCTQGTLKWIRRRKKQTEGIQSHKAHRRAKGQNISKSGILSRSEESSLDWDNRSPSRRRCSYGIPDRLSIPFLLFHADVE